MQLPLLMQQVWELSPTPCLARLQAVMLCICSQYELLCTRAKVHIFALLKYFNADAGVLLWEIVTQVMFGPCLSQYRQPLTGYT